jgi:hypothetical protein
VGRGEDYKGFKIKCPRKYLGLRGQFGIIHNMEHLDLYKLASTIRVEKCTRLQWAEQEVRN